MSMFRASPWVSYHPTNHNRRSAPEPTMNDDVVMEAPQISILREEDSPPPPPPAPKKPTIIVRSRKAPPARVETTAVEPAVPTLDQEDQEDEEDQLIDDDDDDMHKDSSSAVARSGDTTPKKKIPAKRKARKLEKKNGEAEKRLKESQPIVYEATERVDNEVNASNDSLATKAKKKASPKKTTTIPRPKLKLPKPNPSLLSLDVELSESYAATAASSPVTAPVEQNTPEPENVPPSSPPAAPLPPAEEPNLENVPVPLYPLPTKPFPVQPPQKITTGFAPSIPLDKSGKRPRQWREARREIRGIAGGRWLVRTWVGDKESEYADFIAVSNSHTKTSDDKSANNSVSLPKLPSLSISAPVGKNRLKASSKSASAATSAAPSRAPSTIPDNPGSINASTVRAPTKMRILQQFPPDSEGGDSDMAPPTDT